MSIKNADLDCQRTGPVDWIDTYQSHLTQCFNVIHSLAMTKLLNHSRGPTGFLLSLGLSIFSVQWMPRY